MIEKSKRIIDKGGHFSALLTDISKAFDCLPHDLLIAKLDAYGFKNDALYLIFNYLNNRKQRVKINSSFSSFQNIISGVPQGSLLGPLLFNIFLQTFFFFVLLKLQAMLMTTHHTQREFALKKLCKK